MNRYCIDYTDRNGSSHTTNEIAANEQALRAAFKKENPKDRIDGVTLLDSDIPATKGQERQAVEQIQGILRDLGPESYVSAAMKGVLKVALENIEDDTACSMYDRMVYAEDEAAKAQREAADANREVKGLKDSIEQMHQELSALRESHDKAHLELAETQRDLMDSQQGMQAAQQEITALKARLYDVLMAGQENG